MSERCGVCRTPMPETVDEAADLGWYPEWYHADGSEGKGPVCPSCLSTYFDFDLDDGPPTVKPGVKLPLESP